MGRPTYSNRMGDDMTLGQMLAQARKWQHIYRTCLWEYDNGRTWGGKNDNWPQVWRQHVARLGREIRQMELEMQHEPPTARLHLA